MKIFCLLTKRIDFSARFISLFFKEKKKRKIYPQFYPQNTQQPLLFFLVLAFVLLFPRALLAAPRIIWVGNASLLAGKYQYHTNADTVGKQASLTVSPVIAFGTTGTLFPIYLGNYKSFGDILDVAGGATAFKETQEHQGIVKWSQKFHQGIWAVKPFASAKAERFKENESDQWGKGLFDQNRYGSGLTLSYRTKPQGPSFHLLSLGYSFYYTQYPNFRSSLSRFEGELESKNSGTKILDNRAHYVELKTEHFFTSNWRSENTFIYTQRRFNDQRIIQDNGLFIPDTRSDNEMRFEFGASYLFNSPTNHRTPHVNRSVGFEYSLQSRRSNQNHYDPTQLFFTPRYYDFNQRGVAINGQWAFSRLPIHISLKYSYEIRDYTNRLVQNAFGLYDVETITQRTHVWTANVSYPLWKGFSLRFLRNIRRSTSNTDYERFYRYNFMTSNYLFGISYEF